MKRGTFKNKPRKPLARSGFKAKTAPRIKKRATGQIDGNKRKVKTQSQLKKELDRVFSLFIRQKYADKQTGMVTCYTCSTRKHWKEMQNGHWIPRNNLSTRFSEENCRVQCVGCNMFQKGRPDVFAVNLLKEGVDIVALEQTKYRVFKIDRTWYEERIAYYSQRIESLV